MEQQPHPVAVQNNGVEVNENRGQASLMSKVPREHLYVSYLYMLLEPGSIEQRVLRVGGVYIPGSSNHIR